MCRARIGSALAVLAAFLLVTGLAAPAWPAGDNVQYWAREFPLTDFTRHAVPLSEIRSDGATRNTIPAISRPKFVPVKRVNGIGDLEPMITVSVQGQPRAYPLRMMLWHETVNDTILKQPIVVTFCPLCNSAVVYDRRMAGRTLTFGNTGRLRHFNGLIFDKETESWWQQFTGEAVIGNFMGRTLKALPSRVESLALFRDRHPDGLVMVPKDPGAHPYGTTPFVRMDSSPGDGLERYNLPWGVKPFQRLVVIGEEAWTVDRLAVQPIERKKLFVTVEPGQNSVHDTKWIQFGRNVGNAIARVYDADSDEWTDTRHDIVFAFLFRAFHPKGRVHVR